MPSHPMFHEQPTKKHHAALCFSCVFRNAFAAKKLKPTFPLEAFRLFGDLLTMTLNEKNGRVGRGSEASCADILKGLHSNSYELMGGLAPMVFENLGIRSTKDLDDLMEEALKAELFLYKEDGDRFSNYNIDILELLRNPDVKGSQ